MSRCLSTVAGRVVPCSASPAANRPRVRPAVCLLLAFFATRKVLRQQGLGQRCSDPPIVRSAAVTSTGQGFPRTPAAEVDSRREVGATIASVPDGRTLLAARQANAAARFGLLDAPRIPNGGPFLLPHQGPRLKWRIHHNYVDVLRPIPIEERHPFVRLRFRRCLAPRSAAPMPTRSAPSPPMRETCPNPESARESGNSDAALGAACIPSGARLNRTLDRRGRGNGPRSG